MVALYWLLNFLLTYWFISDVFPTLHFVMDHVNHMCTFAVDYPLSPRIITLSNAFFLVLAISQLELDLPTTATFLRFQLDRRWSHAVNFVIGGIAGVMKKLLGKFGRQLLLKIHPDLFSAPQHSTLKIANQSALQIINSTLLDPLKRTVISTDSIDKPLMTGGQTIIAVLYALESKKSLKGDSDAHKVIFTLTSPTTGSQDIDLLKRLKRINPAHPEIYYRAFLMSKLLDLCRCLRVEVNKGESDQCVDVIEHLTSLVSPAVHDSVAHLFHRHLRYHSSIPTLSSSTVESMVLFFKSSNIFFHHALSASQKHQAMTQLWTLFTRRNASSTSMNFQKLLSVPVMVAGEFDVREGLLVIPFDFAPPCLELYIQTHYQTVQSAFHSAVSADALKLKWI